MVGGNAIHIFGLLSYAAKKITAANHNCDLDAKTVDIGKLSRDLVHALVVDTKTLAGGKRLA
jgi:hypothetical protein